MLWKKIIGTLGAFGLATAGALALAGPAQAATPGDVAAAPLVTSLAQSDEYGDTFEPTKPEHKDATCDKDKGYIKIPDDEGVIYKIDGEKADPRKHWLKPGEYEVTAKPKDDGDDDAKKTWIIKIDRPKDCPKDDFEPTKPEHKDATCDKDKGYIKIPDDEGVIYKIDGEKADPGKHWLKPGEYEVTAKPKDDGDDDAKKTWIIKIDRPKDCPKDDFEPTKPEHKDATCDKDKGYIKIPDDDGVIYKIDGEKADPGKHWLKPGEYEVTAKPKDDGDDDAKKTWIIKIDRPKDCPDDKKDQDDDKKDDKLPVTGTSSGLVAGGALGLVVLGGGFYLLARQRRISFIA